ncbi:MAG: hypothetical protein M0R66_02205 [Candidatus Omnitrophica bacterium]|nr:hypothetical protein [Candidatus Omnitrophota bacterium]
MMFWIVVGLVVIMVGAPWWSVTHPLEYYEYDERVGLGASLFFGLTGLGLFLLFLAAVPMHATTPTFTCPNENPVRLQALATSTELQGSVYISILGGAGSVDTHPSFRYIADYGDGSFSLAELSAPGVLIRESDDGYPRLECIKTTKVFDAHWLAPWLGPYTSEPLDHWEFIVPKGSVVTGFEVAP